jgi:hypothetical protein
MGSSIRQLGRRGRLPPGAFRWLALQIRQPIVEFDVALASAEGFDEMGLVRQQEAGITGLQDHLGICFEHLIAQSAFKHPNDAPHAGLGARCSRRRPAGSVVSSKIGVHLYGTFDGGAVRTLMEVSHFGNEWHDRRDRSYGPLRELSEGAE